MHPSGAPDPDPPRLNELIEQAWEELRSIARAELHAGGSARDSASSLLGDAMARLLDQRNPVRNAEQLRGLTRIFLRRILVDRRRTSARERRSLGHVGAVHEAGPATGRGLELAEALDRLGEHDERTLAALTLSAIHRLRQEEIADVLGTSVATVERDLRFARAWVAARLGERS
jgi:RNA polymerase sigma factor (TIGR02999 family)